MDTHQASRGLASRQAGAGAVRVALAPATMQQRAPQFLVRLEPQYRWWEAITALWKAELRPASIYGNALFRDLSESQARLPRRALFSSALFHFAIALFLIRVPYLFFTGSSNAASRRLSGPIIYYDLRSVELPKSLPQIIPPGPGGKPGRGIHPENLPRLGSSAFHPKMTIVMNFPRPDNNRQTILQPASPPDLRITEELRVPNILAGNPFVPQKPRFEFRSPVAGPKVKTRSVQNPEAPRVAVAPAELALPAVPESNSQPRLPLPPITPPSVPRAGQAAGNAGSNGGDGVPGNADGILAIGVDPANTSQLALPPGNRLASFIISPAGGQPGSPGGIANGDPLGGRGGLGSGGDGSSGTGPGNSGGGGGGNGGKGANAVLSITGGTNKGGSGLAGQPLVSSPNPESLVYPVPTSPRVRRPALVVSAGPIGGGGLRVYGVLLGGQIYTVYVDMPGGPWILQYCELRDPAAPARSTTQSRMIRIGGPLAPPEPEEKFDFHRPPVPPDKRNSHVVLHGIIREDGSVGRLAALQGMGPEMQQAALAAFRKWKFTPALGGGKPVTVEILMGIPAIGAEPK